MAIVGQCSCLWTQQSAFVERRRFVSISPRLVSVGQAELGVKPLVSTRIGSTRASVQSQTEFSRPSSVVYGKELANSVNLIGCVGVDPSIQYQDSGEIVATSSLSVKKTPLGEPTWFFLEFQSDLAEIAAQHVRKGDRIHVAGCLIIESVLLEPKEQKQTILKVVVSNLHFVEDVYGTQAQPLTPSEKNASVLEKKQAVLEKKQAAEKAWKLFFDNPNDWYDNRDKKRHPRYPDFKHKTTGYALWIVGFYVPKSISRRIKELEEQGVLKTYEKPT